MAIDITRPGSPGWWLNRLLQKLAVDLPRLNMLDEYSRCTNGIPVHASKGSRDAYRRLMRIARTNFAELVVEAVRERMMPTGFRTGATGDENGDTEAWRIWQANSLDADSSLLFRAQLTMSRAAMIVGGVDESIGAPLITIEDPRQVVWETDPRRRRNVLAALKVFRDETDLADVCYLFLPGVVYRATRVGFTGELSFNADGWDWDSKEALPAPVVPVVPFVNQSDLYGLGVGEFESHLSLLDRINYTTLNRLEVATLQAFRQRAIKGSLPKHDAQGNEIDYDDVFAADPGALWELPDGVDLWESGQVDLGPIRSAIRDDVQDLAAVTRTPLFYLTPDSANGSAEGASLAREGLVFKTQDRLTQAGESLERVMALAFLFAGDTERAQHGDMEVIWAPPERYSLTEKADAASKAMAGGVPWRTVMADIWQFSPQQIARMESERAMDLFLTSTVVEPTF